MTLRLTLSLVLVFMLALTSQTMALARGAAAPVGHMVLCIGSGSVTVYTDAQGQPTEAPHFCPDCAVGAVLLPTAQHVAVPVRVVLLEAPCTLSALCGPLPRGFVPQTRAPPLFV